jgi:hypothetical protein
MGVWGVQSGINKTRHTLPVYAMRVANPQLTYFNSHPKGGRPQSKYHSLVSRILNSPCGWPTPEYPLDKA